MKESALWMEKVKASLRKVGRSEKKERDIMVGVKKRPGSDEPHRLHKIYMCVFSPEFESMISKDIVLLKFIKCTFPNVDNIKNLLCLVAEG